jgi:hypothetical protein
MAATHFDDAKQFIKAFGIENHDSRDDSFPLNRCQMFSRKAFQLLMIASVRRKNSNYTAGI